MKPCIPKMFRSSLLAKERYEAGSKISQADEKIEKEALVMGETLGVLTAGIVGPIFPYSHHIFVN